MMKHLGIISVFLISYSCQIKEYECACYYEEEGKISYDTYITKNNKKDSEEYCMSLSTVDRKCAIKNK